MQLVAGLALGVPDFSRTDWSQLFNVRSFSWTDNVTPFSQPELPLLGVGLYLITILFLKLYMDTRPAVSKDIMARISAAHNLLLCVWSILMSGGTIIAATQRAMVLGPATLVCEKDPNVISGTMYYWSLIYHYSKYYELLDTVIICLRKNQITFLHVYHHLMMVILTRIWITPGHPLHWCSVFLNSFVHIFMYWFYFKRSLGLSVWWKKYITQLQLVQFTIFLVMMLIYLNYEGVFSTSFDFFGSLYGNNCVGPLWVVWVTLVFNVSLLYLFSRFYGRTYDESNPNPNNKQTPNNNNNNKQTASKQTSNNRQKKE